MRNKLTQFKCYHCDHEFEAFYIVGHSDIYCPRCLRGIVTQ